jgi:DNA-binding NarL/FixJ family response regulator
MQRKVLAVLCSPLQERRRLALPATNRAIADELVLSIEAVKTHMRALFEKFAVEDLPHNQKRARLAELALQAGVLNERR